MEGESLKVSNSVVTAVLINLLELQAGFKVINDSVHGHMEFHPLCIMVIDTPEFQRLRNIRQMGITHLVYPSAAHSRFEHSLGVCHLAGLMIDVLKRNNPTVEITEEEKLCVQMAGLCHDLGHGPFSHLWEDFLKKCEVDWRHEEQSIKMFDHLLKKNELLEEFQRYNLGEREIRFIKDLILGRREPLHSRKQFLFQIVNNKINDIDVDKWDYYMRDGLHLNLKFTFDYTRMMQFIRIMPTEEAGNREVLVFKAKEAYSIYEMFNVRAKIHLAAAQHRVVLVLHRMLLDALGAADDHFLQGSKLSKAHKDLDTWTKLSDNILFDIVYSDSTLLSSSQNILNRIIKRRLYKFITLEELSVCVDDPNKLTEELEKDLAKQYPGFGLVVTHCWFHLSSMKNDPFTRIYFYDKRNPNQLVKKKWNDIELFRSAEDPDPNPHCKIYIFSKILDLSNDQANVIRLDFPRILQNRLP